ncbi:MAG: phosphoglycerate kinase, partial [Rhodothermales bacterium]|nr:phosphoglycerate kinase [Rhodothermales bacterium]
MTTPTLEGLDVAGRRVLVRVDFNVPLTESADGSRVVADDTRIRAALPTIRHILDAGGSAILMSHLGRPKGEPNDAFRMAPVSKRLAELLNVNVIQAPETVGQSARAIASGLGPGDVMLLENTRFNPGETANDAEFSRALASLGDVYVNDAFGAAHRAHASTEGITRFIDERAAGFLLAAELKALGKLLDAPDHPFVALIGGAKVSDKIGVIRSLLEHADRLLVGGAMAYTFLAAGGTGVGSSMTEPDQFDLARDLMRESGDRLLLPVDHVCGDRFAADADSRTVDGDIPDGWMGLDIGPKTIARYREALQDAGTIVWNGPMGVFEMPAFADGTNA